MTYSWRSVERQRFTCRAVPEQTRVQQPPRGVGVKIPLASRPPHSIEKTLPEPRESVPVRVSRLQCVFVSSGRLSLSSEHSFKVQSRLSESSVSLLTQHHSSQHNRETNTSILLPTLAATTASPTDGIIRINRLKFRSLLFSSLLISS